jgi:hypothetical protein
MQIKVYTIDVKLPRWLKRAVLFGAIPAAVMLGAVHYLRADVTVRHSFTNGQLLSASDINDNFSDLQSGLNSLAGTVTTLQGTVSSGSAPAGTIIAYGGPIDGNPGAGGTTKPPPAGSTATEMRCRERSTEHYSALSLLPMVVVTA